MKKKIVIAGATGLIGKRICSKLIERGDEVTILTRSVDNAKTAIPRAAKYVYWNLFLSDWMKELEGAEAVINLAGENLMAKRWTDAHKKNIRDSRIITTAKLIEAISCLKVKPKVFISASAVGFYGSTENEVDETSKMGEGFLAELVNDWEKETQKVDELNIRRINVRIGIVLDKNEGALAKMITPFKFFVGGPLGSGNQWMPWIHINDLTNIFLFSVDNDNVKGIINGVTPNPVRMNEFAGTIGKVLNRPSIFKVPGFVLKIILGEAASVVLEGANVKPKKLQTLGYKFLYDDLEKALTAILK